MKSIKILSLILVASTLIPASAHAWSWGDLVKPTVAAATLYGAYCTYYYYPGNPACQERMISSYEDNLHLTGIAGTARKGQRKRLNAEHVKLRYEGLEQQNDPAIRKMKKKNAQKSTVAGFFTLFSAGYLVNNYVHLLSYAKNFIKQ